MKPRHLIAVLAVVVSTCLAGCEGRPRTAKPGQGEPTATPSDDHVAVIDLRRGAPESRRGALLADARTDSFADLVLELRGMDEVETLKGIFVRLGAAQLDLAQSEELGRSLAALREDKRQVVCHADGYTNSTILLAAQACDEIWLSPAGMVDTVGLAAQLLFGRALLDKLNVAVDFVQVGKYKGGIEPFTRDSASPEARESVATMLRGTRAAWLEGVEAGRRKSPGALGLEDGPHPASAALALGLIDAIGFEGEARARALEVAGATGTITYFGKRPDDGGGLADLVRLLSGTESMGVPHVAVVAATGGITLADGGSAFTTSDGIVERELSELLDELTLDDDTKAVVLRIDSPGGSALASDLLWRRLMDLRAEKPLVVSIGAMAASGGYYLAAAGHQIVAERTSVIGSIGVYGGKLSFAGSLAEIGVQVETIAADDPDGSGSSSRALYSSPLSPWDEATRNKIHAAVENAYDLFLTRITEGRGLTRDQVTPAAEGRLMAGDDGKQAGLIDQIGGLDAAITLALELGKLEAETPVQLIHPPSGLMSLLGMDAAAAQVLAAEQLQQQAARAATQALTAGLQPFSAEIDAFRASLSPLLQGETVIAALPFAILVR